ncbi:hypothetical protein [Opitutus sp. ER46]|uniref:hypothetical protein n=1 Tax=Opitutus sp. ER46 TaxID=2161864 RepID=UPI000D2FD9D9|nr:hypothetical protein [Opitutus sp. ER46]PTX94618.1 hypothetical protein DB354_12875 [Opitutus sp. ER46]
MTPSTSTRHGGWTALQQAVGAGPLEYCPRLPEIAARWERWWRFSAERPLLIASAPTRPAGYRGKAFHLLHDPERWLAKQRAELETTHYVADTLPRIRADIGPVAIAAFLGAPLTVSEAEQTTWQQPIFSDWEHSPTFAYDPENPWLQRVLALLRALADDARGRYVVCTPDLTGAIDTLVNLRGPAELCLDLFDHREAVIAASLRIMEAWEQIYGVIMDTVLDRGAAITQWLAPWSDRPFTIPTCDFTALIGHDDFVECCLPSLRRQAEIAGRMLFHLDGPQAARHAPTLAAEPGITAIQYTPGAGTPSALAKLDLLRRIQAAGKPVLVITPKAEVARLARQLDRRGLAMLVEDPLTPAEADELATSILPP